MLAAPASTDLWPELGRWLLDLGCMVLAGLAGLEMARGFWLFYRWRKGQIEPGTYANRIWLKRTKIAVAALVLPLLWFGSPAVRTCAGAAAFLLVLSILITESEFLRRFKPVRMMRGLRLMVGFIAGWVGVVDLLKGTP